MAEDKSGSTTAPATQAFSITPSDTVDLAVATRAIYVGGTGDLKVDMTEGPGGVTFSAVPAGKLLPIRVKRVYSTGTTATLLLGVF